MVSYLRWVSTAWGEKDPTTAIAEPAATLSAALPLYIVTPRPFKTPRTVPLYRQSAILGRWQAGRGWRNTRRRGEDSKEPRRDIWKSISWTLGDEARLACNVARSRRGPPRGGDERAPYMELSLWPPHTDFDAPRGPTSRAVYGARGHGFPKWDDSCSRVDWVPLQAPSSIYKRKCCSHLKRVRPYWGPKFKCRWLPEGLNTIRVWFSVSSHCFRYKSLWPIMLINGLTIQCIFTATIKPECGAINNIPWAVGVK